MEQMTHMLVQHYTKGNLSDLIDLSDLLNRSDRSPQIRAQIGKEALGFFCVYKLLPGLQETSSPG